MKDLREYNSDRLALYKIYDWVDDEWIIERHSKLERRYKLDTKIYQILPKSIVDLSKGFELISVLA